MPKLSKRAYAKKYYREHKEKWQTPERKAYAKKWARENQDKVLAGTHRYRRKNPDLFWAKRRFYTANNREKIRQWMNVSLNRRRARLSGAGGKHSPQEWNSLKEIYEFCCARCGRREPEIKLTKDHKIPIALGGTDNIDNIQPLCQSCNSQKYKQVCFPACLLISQEIIQIRQQIPALACL